MNAGGALIGINTAIFSQSGGYMGIGFAIPVNMARQVMDQLVTTRGRMTRGHLGVAVQELTPTLARGLGLSDMRGLVVADVSPDGPAANSGLRRGDVITVIDGKPVEDVGHFRNLIASAPPGTKARLTIVRDGREQTVDVTIGAAPERTTAAAAPGARQESPGLSVADVTPELPRRLGLPPELQGVVVTQVLPGSPAAEAGIRPGDIIQEVNRQPVASARDFSRVVAQGGDRDFVVVVNRGGATTYAVIERG